MHAEQCHADSTFGMGLDMGGEVVMALEDGMDAPLMVVTLDVETARAVQPYETDSYTVSACHNNWCKVNPA